MTYGYDKIGGVPILGSRKGAVLYAGAQCPNPNCGAPIFVYRRFDQPHEQALVLPLCQHTDIDFELAVPQHEDLTRERESIELLWRCIRGMQDRLAIAFAMAQGMQLANGAMKDEQGTDDPAE